MDLLKDLTMEYLSDEQKGLAEIIGLEPLKKLAKYCQGSSIYVPKTDSLISGYRNSLIQEEYNGYNAKELASKYGLCVRRIRSIIAESKQI